MQTSPTLPPASDKLPVKDSRFGIRSLAAHRGPSEMTRLLYNRVSLQGEFWPTTICATGSRRWNAPVN
jgi:hypothetical protein